MKKKPTRIISRILSFTLAFMVMFSSFTSVFAVDTGRTPGSIPNRTYIIGTHEFTSKMALTTSRIMIAARTIQGDNLTEEDMVIYYKNPYGNWINATNGKPIPHYELPQSFTITHTDLEGEVVVVSAISVTGTGDATTIETNGGTLQMIATVSPDNASNKAVTWTVTETDGTATDKATISNTGLLTAVKNGTVKVTATAKDGSGKSGFANITITNQMIEKTAAEVAALITTIPAPAKDATSLTLPTVEAGFTVAIKTSDKTGVIALSGTITPPATEETVALVLEVTKTSDSTKADTVSINVVVPAKTVVLGAPVTGLDVVLEMGKTITATASTTEPGASTWTSSDTSVATVDANTGVVTALKAGKTTIAYTASTSGNLNSKEITVYAATFTSQTDNSISNDVATLGLEGNEVSSSNSSVATGAIESGRIKITSIAQGSTTITVKSALNYEAKIAVTVAVDGTILIGAISKPALNVTYNINGGSGAAPTQAPLTSGDKCEKASLKKADFNKGINVAKIN